MNCTCGSPVVLYWVRDDVWQPAAPAATSVGGHLCLNCAANAIGRPLTLHDLAIANYVRTAQNMAGVSGFMQQYARATVIGACNATNTPIPAGWSQPTAQPHTDALGIGEQLARQTQNPQAALPVLVAEVNRCFPDSELAVRHAEPGCI